MASVTSFTADRSREIERNTVTGGYVDHTGELILVREAGNIVAGDVTGPPGPSAGYTPGVILMYAGDYTSVPTGFQHCHGQAVSRTTYANLFNRLGVMYGPGNGTTTFNLPNFINRFPIGADDPPGAIGGTSSHSLTTDNMPEHSHGLPDGANLLGTTRPIDPGRGARTPHTAGAYNIAFAEDETVSVYGNTSLVGNGVPIDNRPPFLGIFFIIRMI